MSTKKGLNPRQKLFIAEYLKDKNAKQAAIRAGYSAKAAEVNGPRLLSNAKICSAVDEALEKQQNRTEATADRVIKELALIAFSDMADYVEVGPEGEVRVKSFTEMPEGASRVIAGIKEVRRIMGSGEGNGKEIILEARLEYKHYDKVAALNTLAKHFGLLKDKLEVTGTLTLEQLVAASRREPDTKS